MPKLVPLRWKKLPAAAPLHMREALVSMPALPLAFLIGQWMVSATAGTAAAGASLSVGCAAGLRFGPDRLRAMAGACASIPLAAMLGLVIGHNEIAFIGTAAAAASGCAFLALVHPGVWWIALQGVLAFLVAGFHAGPDIDIFASPSYALGGAVLQLILGGLLAQALVRCPAPTDMDHDQAPPPAVPSARQASNYALSAGLCVASSAVAAHLLALPQGYWAAMASLLVLKPRASATWRRAGERLAGTVLGAALASFVAIAMLDKPTALLVAATISFGALVAFQKAPYVYLAVAISATVVFLPPLAGGSAVSSAEHRLLATMLGAVVATLIAGLLSPLLRELPHEER